jgi:rubrerythrin
MVESKDLPVHTCPTCGAVFRGRDERFCPSCHEREHAGSPLGFARTSKEGQT